MTAGAQAEYLDHVSKCGDCGAELVAVPGAFVKLAALPAQDLSLEDPAETAEEARERQGRMDVMVGIFGIFGGIAITAGTYALALNGEVYLVAWGPIVFGVLRLVRGFWRRSKM